jgi:hypothetical protein
MAMAISRSLTAAAMIIRKLPAARYVGTRNRHIEHPMQAPVMDLGLLPVGNAGAGATSFSAGRWTRPG